MVWVYRERQHLETMNVCTWCRANPSDVLIFLWISGAHKSNQDSSPRHHGYQYLNPWQSIQIAVETFHYGKKMSASLGHWREKLILPGLCELYHWQKEDGIEPNSFSDVVMKDWQGLSEEHLVHFVSYKTQTGIRQSRFQRDVFLRLEPGWARSPLLLLVWMI